MPVLDNPRHGSPSIRFTPNRKTAVTSVNAYPVETLANVPPIIRNGARWYRAFGTSRIYQILSDIAEGTAHMALLKDLEQLSQNLVLLSNCGLGQTAGVPIRDILQYFWAEVEAHIKLKVCPTGACPMRGRQTIAA